MISLPEQFIHSLKDVMSEDEIQDFILHLEQPSATSIRFNPYKTSQKPDLENIPWSKYGFYLPHRPSFTLEPEFHSGAYYVQESSSMFVEHIVRECFDKDENITALDLCASPGGKTTLLSSIVGLESVVHANEVIRQRAQTLADNVKKWGLGNVIVTNNDPSHFDSSREFYDLILVDAPCSGEGMFRKDKAAREQWSADNVELCAARQKRILSQIWQSLKPGGILIYSTCTFNRKENEENIKWLTSEYDCEKVDISCHDEWNITQTESNGHGCFRFFPGKIPGEGFFVSVVRKADDKIRTKLSKSRREVFENLNNKERSELKTWFNQGELMHTVRANDKIYTYYGQGYERIKQIAERYSVVYSGIEMGQFFNSKFKPEHPLALFFDINKTKVNACFLSKEDAQDFLRKKDISAENFEQGLNLVCYNNLPLGWAKRIQNRVNNLYPKELRIMNL
ncbi:MAG: rRNA cytosine-C5-methylase [Rikenellaceae bacterium]